MKERVFSKIICSVNQISFFAQLQGSGWGVTEALRMLGVSLPFRSKL